MAKLLMTGMREESSCHLMCDSEMHAVCSGSDEKMGNRKIIRAIKLYGVDEVQRFVNEDRCSIGPEEIAAINYVGEDTYILWFWEDRKEG